MNDAGRSEGAGSVFWQLYQHVEAIHRNSPLTVLIPYTFESAVRAHIILSEIIIGFQQRFLRELPKPSG